MRLLREYASLALLLRPSVMVLVHEALCSRAGEAINARAKLLARALVVDQVREAMIAMATPQAKIRIGRTRTCAVAAPALSRPVAVMMPRFFKAP